MMPEHHGLPPIGRAEVEVLPGVAATPHMEPALNSREPNNSTMGYKQTSSNFIEVCIGTKRLSSGSLVSKARTHVAMLRNNAVFPDPTPSLAVVDACAAELDLANQRYQFSHGRIDRQLRDIHHVRLAHLIRLLSAYVGQHAAGNSQLISSAGFAVKKKRQPSHALPAPGNLRAKRSPYPNTVDLRWNAVKNRGSYTVQINAGDLNNEADWKVYASTTRNYIAVEGLTARRSYGFRVLALGALGASPTSDLSMAEAG